MISNSSNNESLLLEMAAAGDRRAFTQLYKDHLNNVFNYIFLFTKSKEETEELIQDVFVKIWENREKLPDVQFFKSYLFKMAKNKLIDQVRHQQIKYRVFAEVKRTKVASEDITTNQAAYKEYYLIVQQAIEKLPTKRKFIFKLSTENGLSHDEIAARLNISKSAVKKQLYNASDFVRNYLAKHGELSLSIMAAWFISAT